MSRRPSARRCTSITTRPKRSTSSAASTPSSSRIDEIVCPAGSFVYVPAGIRHGFRVGTVRSRKLNIYAPAAMVGYFDELSAAVARGVTDPDALAEIALRHAMEITGPVPEGYL